MPHLAAHAELFHQGVKGVGPAEGFLLGVGIGWIRTVDVWPHVVGQAHVAFVERAHERDRLALGGDEDVAARESAG